MHFETWLQMERRWGFDFSNASAQHNQERQRQEHKCSKGPTEFQTNRKAGKQWESGVGNALYLCSPTKTQKEKEQNKNNPKLKIKQKEGSWGTLGNAELWEKCSFREEQNGGKVFHTRKALFSLEQIHLAAFLAVLRLKAEKQQQESMQARRQSSSFIVPREVEDMIRKQPQALLDLLLPLCWYI